MFAIFHENIGSKVTNALNEMTTVKISLLDELFSLFVVKDFKNNFFDGLGIQDGFAVRNQVTIDTKAIATAGGGLWRDQFIPAVVLTRHIETSIARTLRQTYLDALRLRCP